MKDALNYIFSKKEKIRLIYILMLVIIGGVIELLGVAVFTPFIEMITTPELIEEKALIRVVYNALGFSSVNDFIIGIAICIIGIYVLKNLFLTYEKNAVYRFSYGMQQRVAQRLLTAYLDEPYSFHLRTNPAQLVRTVQVDTDLFSKAVIHTIELVMELVVCSALVCYLFIVSPMITIITSLALAIAVSLYILISKRWLRTVGRQSQKYAAEVLEYANQSLGGIKEIKVLNRQSYFVSKFATSFANNVRCIRLSRLASVLPKYFVEAICIVGLMVAVIIEIHVDSGNINKFIPQLAVFATAAFRLMPSVGRINEHTAAINNCFPSVDLIYKDLLSVETMPEYLENQEDGASYKIELREKIVFNDVSFKYDDADHEVISGASFVIHKGETVAFIGESGSGKTTLIDILLGILEPRHGVVVVDGLDIRDNIKGWQKNIGYIPQTIYLSDDTIRNNIAFGLDDESIDDAKVIEAAKRAQLYDFVLSLANGFDTEVGERGARLSGGQRQRIGIARALYHNPEVLILDEATSALDNDTEKAVMEAIDGLHGEKTIIIIAHRLSTIKNADMIYEVIDGKVIEQDKRLVLDL